MKNTRNDLLERLDALGLKTTTVDHVPVFTVEESQKHTGDLPGGHCKNLFLKDKKSALWLVVTLEDRPIDMKDLRGKIGSHHLSFGKPDLLMDVLGVMPGSVTPFALINDTETTVNVVLDAGKITSIRDIDISPGFFSNGPWGKKLITVEGESLSLDDIEHRILRPIWQDPRIHYALNCAALSCPNLWGVAVTVENIETYLNHGAKAFINHPRGSRVEGGRVVASSIYKWFAEDFGGTDAAIIDHIKGYASDDLVAALDGVTDVEFESYDWTLNSNVLPNLVAVGTRRGS